MRSRRTNRAVGAATRTMFNASPRGELIQPTPDVSPRCLLESTREINNLLGLQIRVSSSNRNVTRGGRTYLVQILLINFNFLGYPLSVFNLLEDLHLFPVLCSRQRANTVSTPLLPTDWTTSPPCSFFYKYTYTHIPILTVFFFEVFSHLRASLDTLTHLCLPGFGGTWTGRVCA